MDRQFAGIWDARVYNDTEELAVQQQTDDDVLRYVSNLGI